jgi:hypothetical protein
MISQYDFVAKSQSRILQDRKFIAKFSCDKNEPLTELLVGRRFWVS